MYCGDHDALRVPGPRVRALRAHERAAARHVPEHDEVRGRDHRDDPRHAARRRGHRRRAGRARHVGRQRQHPARGARVPRVRAATSAASTGRTSSSPRPRTPRSTRRATCSASSAGARRSTRRRRTADVDAMAKLIDENTIAMVGSACNYGYGTIDPIDELVRPRPRARHRPARRRLPRRVHPAVGPGARLPDIPLFDFRVPGVTTHLGRHAQVRLRPQGHVGARVPRQGAAQQPVLLHDRLDRRQVRVARHRGLAFGRAARRDVGVDGEHRPRGLPEVRQGDLRHRVRDAGRRARRTPSCASSARRRSASASRATSSTSTTSTTSCGRRAGASTASSTRTRSTWR